MATIIEKTGKTVEEALQAALSELGVDEKDVEMEVLEKPSKGILGLFGNKPARIRVTLKEVPKPEVVGESPTTINFRTVPSLDTLPKVDDEPEPAADEINSETKLDAENKLDAESDVKAESNVDAETKLDAESDVKAAPKLESETTADTENKLDAESDVETESNVDAESNVKAESEGVTPAVTDDAENISYDAENLANVDRAEIIERAKKFLFDVYAAMNVELQIDVSEDDENIILNLTEKKSAALIGKHGQNLDALQYLTNLAANKNSLYKVRFILDVGDYRERREVILKKMAKSAAERVVRTRKEVKMEPMSRHERLIIHTALQDNKRVETHSYGTEPHRHIVVSLKRKSK
ncbi:MAG: Jag N-terminal domain-containing protein [Selenomonadaceae bacterium]|nr:Jag N-terminal domain-containing protein [Selenomonadaceae bacterium]